MIRNFRSLDTFLNRLLKDVYAQPADEGHTLLARGVYDGWLTQLHGVKTVLDAGCGDVAFMKPWCEELGWEYTGIALGTNNPSVKNMDFTFTEFEDYTFDLIIARHALEHSPMPVVTLMEWERIGKHFLCLINPNPDHYGFVGQNHYSVANKAQLIEWLTLAGWSVIWEDDSEPSEIRLMCQKKGR